MSTITQRLSNYNLILVFFMILLAFLLQYNTAFAQDSCSLQASLAADGDYANSREAGEVFQKSWSIRNEGRCDWPRDLSLVLVGGDRMSGPTRIPLKSVGPGKVLEINIDLQAPQKVGQHAGTWQLEAEGIRFGPSLRVGIEVNQRIDDLVNPIPPQEFPGPADGFGTPPPEIVHVYADVATIIEPGGHAFSEVTCEEGVVTGGGWSLSDAFEGARVHHSSQFENGWVVHAHNPTDEPATVYAYAVCLKNTQATTFESIEVVTLGGYDIISHTALCPAGSILTGGGISHLPAPFANIRSWSSGPSPTLNGWYGSAMNLGDLSHDLVVHATCMLASEAERYTISNSTNAPYNPSFFSPGIATVECHESGLASSGGVGTGMLNFYISLPTGNGDGWMNLAINEAHSHEDLAMSVWVNCLTFP
ncbi:MAG: hypothetical protein DWQ07_06775 [Chloroflexi bacterium]|nr:MAG: hypothetical protein DWQ07_06775 [Chloroflexota bacterium]MBL1195596.1 hypothetical protein [Chloroflexota bacterium]NOH12883.1 hypothetical protein [Chloroflexota bacterium]